MDSDEILRRIQRARSWAEREEGVWKERTERPDDSDPAASREADMRRYAYEAVRKVLDEIVRPGAHDGG
ncbi:hypothetical protein GCM10010358_49120 [Streptomyces minutiscleroticus]|uniref:Uncharacterized protein n=1 Tax=Streptomyces minutiscleroticus TaxID=68238 RepID=A0A918U3Z3_9ACTN|nr:hypothetical protein GCM10010358_49120 [Streptomyces minutiscleroticus]